MDYIVFYNYENGTRDFGYYTDYEEAQERYYKAIEESEEYGSKVEIGFAEINRVQKVNWSE